VIVAVRERDRQLRLFRVHHEHREELGRLRLAGIGADAVAVAGQLGEALSGLVGRRRSVIDLAADRPLKTTLAGRLAGGSHVPQPCFDSDTVQSKWRLVGASAQTHENLPDLTTSPTLRRLDLVPAESTFRTESTR
jgi:hypothetical protein